MERDRDQPTIAEPVEPGLCDTKYWLGPWLNAEPGPSLTQDQRRWSVLDDSPRYDGLASGKSNCYRRRRASIDSGIRCGICATASQSLYQTRGDRSGKFVTGWSRDTTIRIGIGSSSIGKDREGAATSERGGHIVSNHAALRRIGQPQQIDRR